MTRDDEREDDEQRGKQNVVEILRNAGIQTIVLDEAHHLRTNWWASITFLVNSFKDITIVALTATPPYDVSISEWERYTTLCGPIDAEVSVPELVMQKNLCPHQDLVMFTMPTIAEREELVDIKKQLDEIIESVLSDKRLLQYVLNHPWIRNPTSKMEKILDSPAFFSSMLVFLQYHQVKLDEGLITIVVDRVQDIPRMNKEWLAILLEGLLFPTEPTLKKTPKYFEEIKSKLRRAGALERKSINLREVKSREKVFRKSISKLKAIHAIVMIELQALHGKLRMVILTDFIRPEFLKAPQNKEPNRMGVVPIFESIRRLRLKNCKLAVLSGSLIILPKSAIDVFFEEGASFGLGPEKLRSKPLDQDPEYVKISVNESNRALLVSIVTKVFGRGAINILIGTTSLLGEGWDAPSVNTLILASFVGSYMLSNQMRGRAIRTDPNVPDKTANIWHIICVEPNSNDPGGDYHTIIRRFKAFLGVAFNANIIENGFGRLGVKKPPFTPEDIKEINEEMRRHAKNREGLREAWEKALKKGVSNVKLVEQVRAKRENVPRRFVFQNTLETLAWQTITLAAFFILGKLPGLLFPTAFQGLVIITYISMIGVGIFAIRFFPKLIKAIILFVRHGPVTSSLKQIARAVLTSLAEIGLIKTDLRKIKIKVEKVDKGTMECSIDGGTKREHSLFLTAMQEVLGPIENPRYLLVRRSMLFGRLVRRDYHSVPTILGYKKEFATIFAQMWKKYVGDMDLIYTRSPKGRKILLKARHYSLSAGLRPRTQRISKWE